MEIRWLVNIHFASLTHRFHTLNTYLTQLDRGLLRVYPEVSLTHCQEKYLERPQIHFCLRNLISIFCCLIAFWKIYSFAFRRDLKTLSFFLHPPSLTVSPSQSAPVALDVSFSLQWVTSGVARPDWSRGACERIKRRAGKQREKKSVKSSKEDWRLFVGWGEAKSMQMDGGFIFGGSEKGAYDPRNIVS